MRYLSETILACKMYENVHFLVDCLYVRSNASLTPEYIRIKNQQSYSV